MPHFDQALRILSAPENRILLTRIKRGIEKESLRVTPGGAIAHSPHPAALGSALTHPSITTDYSEALLELITAPNHSVHELINTLEDLHRFIYQNIDDELLWVNSMPCSFTSDSDVPVAQYGSANVARMKTIYRLGLGYRYGRIMQTIAGIHYNWSIPDEALSLLQTGKCLDSSFQDYKTQSYFDLIRNFRRYTWLLLYLFGAAPAVCRSYVKDKAHNLTPFGEDDHSLHAPFGTSLRMGDLGYQSSAQESLIVCYNNLDSYISTLQEALTKPYPPYEAIGQKDDQGQYRQLSTHLLQIENEFYSTVRPKRTTRSGETPIKALKQRGVEYIEVRCVDLNPFSPVGVEPEQLYFLDTFLLFCLVSSSPETDDSEYKAILNNQKATVYQGRNPKLTLNDRGTERSVHDWGKDLLTQMKPIAQLLDDANGQRCYSQSLATMVKRLEQPELTPSAKILDLMANQNTTFFQLALKQAKETRDYFLAKPLDDETARHYRELAAKSLHDQRDIEVGDTLSFEQYLDNYYQQYDL